ncbi:elastin isoform X3 [Oryzias latipes]|uniref:elastin isoform X3 n=1 Tax=Oryzias latipes TaxID=8090 RepID=UPI0005CBC4DD|nr:elastin isoform X3 [Oryzias latipes]
MLLPALTLLLCLAQQTLQGGVKPQSVAYGRPLAAGVNGALGALGSRYGTKAMKTGIGRYPAAHLGTGGYRNLGLGGRGAMRQGGYGAMQGGYGAMQGGYGARGAYGAGMGTGMGLGPGFANGLGINLGQGGKRGYGAGLGALPGYGGFGGAGYPVSRPGVSAAGNGGPDVAGLGQAAPDLKREKSTAVGNQFGDKDRKIGPEMPGMRRTGVLGPNPPESHSGLEVKRLDPLIRSSDLRPAAPLDTQLGMLGLDVSGAHGVGPLGALVPRRKGTLGPEATPAPGGRRGQLPLSKDNIRTLGSAYSRVHSAKDFDPSIQQIPKAKNCGSPLSEVLQQKEGTYRPLTKDPRGNVFSVQGQGSRDYLPSLADRQDAKGPLAKNKNGPTETQGWDFALVGKERDAHGFTGEEARRLSQAERIERKPKALPIPGQAERRTQAASYPAGAGNYLGASVGAGGYGAGLGQGAYLGGAAGKHGGYGDGLTGYLGAVAGNGFGGDAGKTLSAGYGNGFGNGYGTGLDYPAELAVGAEYKAGKSKALGNGGYAAPVQGAFGALGAGLESAGGKYAGGAAAPAHYGNAPVIPAALEGDAGYPYAAQQLGLAAEGTKTASKYGATEGFGAQQAGFGVQLGAAQEALGQQQSKYGGVNGGLGNGYKG